MNNPLTISTKELSEKLGIEVEKLSTMANKAMKTGKPIESKGLILWLLGEDDEDTESFYGSVWAYVHNIGQETDRYILSDKSVSR